MIPENIDTPQKADCNPRLVQPLLEVKLGTNNPRQIIINLMAAFPPSVRDASDEDLVAAFLDMEDADEEIRDTAQAVLEARKYLRESELVDSVMAAIRACPESAHCIPKRRTSRGWTTAASVGV